MSINLHGTQNKLKSKYIQSAKYNPIILLLQDWYNINKTQKFRQITSTKHNLGVSKYSSQHIRTPETAFGHKSKNKRVFAILLLVHSSDSSIILENLGSKP